MKLLFFIASLILAASQASASANANAKPHVHVYRCLINGATSFSDTKCVDSALKLQTSSPASSQASAVGNPVSRGISTCRTGVSEIFPQSKDDQSPRVGDISGGKIDASLKLPNSKSARSFIVPVAGRDSGFVCYTSVDGTQLVKIMAMAAER